MISGLSERRKAEKANTEGVDYCGPGKTNHKGFFLSTFQN